MTVKVYNTMEEFPIGVDLPDDDNSIDLVSIEGWLQLVPTGSPDPLVRLFQEVYRVLKPGGRFTIKARNVAHPLGVGHPLQQRIVTKATLLYFGRPIEEFKNPDEIHWKIEGYDFGVRFKIIPTEDGHPIREDENFYTVIYEK